MARDYKNIKAFKLADELIVAVYKDTKNFPKEERYGLTSQLRRAAVSVATNIVEGSSRRKGRDYLHFLYMARGSLAETGYLLHLSKKLGFLSKDDFINIDTKRDDVAKVLFGLIRAIENEIKVCSL